YCLCGQGESGEMIACDSPSCPIVWFHMDCIGMTTAPDGEWLCRVSKGQCT
ncbi:predicted protein, partial [Nematostella vectensis]